jgi:uncharacterized membrane protein (UPF0127 family)
MMAILENKTQNKILLKDLMIADQMYSRMKGLLGTKDLSEQQGLWIHRCNSIHTFFMKFSIDCVFLDAEMHIKDIVFAVPPGRIVLPRWGSSSVIEMKSGLAKQKEFKVGDQLYVGG